MEGFYVAAIVVLLLVVNWLLAKWREARREKFVRTYMFPEGLLAKLGKQRQGIGRKEQQLVARALRQFFLAHLKSGRKFVSMPSQVVDDLWHEFILYTRAYEKFCKSAFGRFLHHTPAVVLSADKQNNAGLRRVWWHACLEENINPRRHPAAVAVCARRKAEDRRRLPLHADCSGLKRKTSRRSNRRRLALLRRRFLRQELRRLHRRMVIAAMRRRRRRCGRRLRRGLGAETAERTGILSQTAAQMTAERKRSSTRPQPSRRDVSLHIVDA